ncbi:MAG TPA: multicopper oxidase domain-containing protein [Gaiellaceae bacterium]|nr:multicopper oxidase domain-containing protein [Gaiellaceae bacterium]
MDAGRARRHLSTKRRISTGAWAWARACALALAAALLAGGCGGSGGSHERGRTLDYWVAAVPVSWNIAPNGHDALMGEKLSTNETVFPTVVYRAYSPHWRKPEANAPQSSADGLLIPGPLIHARVGDELRIHFKNMDTLHRAPHSMHFHGVHYGVASDGAFIPGFSGPGADVAFGKTFTYHLTAGPDSAGVWPYHDHSPSMMESIEGGMYGMLSILGKDEKAPDREFEVVLAPMGKDFMTVDGRAFVGNTPIFHAKVGDVVQWDVMAMGSEFHTFHVHGHRWLAADGEPKDTQTVGPAETFKIRWREDRAGTWLYHCHVEAHMQKGMIGIYEVSR